MNRLHARLWSGHSSHLSADPREFWRCPYRKDWSCTGCFAPYLSYHRLRTGSENQFPGPAPSIFGVLFSKKCCRKQLWIIYWETKSQRYSRWGIIGIHSSPSGGDRICKETFLLIRTSAKKTVEGSIKGKERWWRQHSTNFSNNQTGNSLRRLHSWRNRQTTCS